MPRPQPSSGSQSTVPWPSAGTGQTGRDGPGLTSPDPSATAPRPSGLLQPSERLALIAPSLEPATTWTVAGPLGPDPGGAAVPGPAPERIEPLGPPLVAAGTARGSAVHIPIRFVSALPDVDADELASTALSVLNDARGWSLAGVVFSSDPDSWLAVVLAEGPIVDALCSPLRTGGRVSCQNGAHVMLNATRWREATATWDSSVAEYREYLLNHEVGHLIGQRHPTPRCPVLGAPAAVMEQQTGGLAGCVGNGWPRPWEIQRAAERPLVVAPDPAWGPEPQPANLES